MKEYLATSSVSEGTSKESAEEMVQTLANDYSALIQELKERCMEVAGEAGDETSAEHAVSNSYNIRTACMDAKCILKITMI